VLARHERLDGVAVLDESARRRDLTARDAAEPALDEGPEDLAHEFCGGDDAVDGGEFQRVEADPTAAGEDEPPRSRVNE